MTGLIHGSARTTSRIRAELQAAQAMSRAVARQYGLNPKAVLKWSKWANTADTPTGNLKMRAICCHRSGLTKKAALFQWFTYGV